jgi:hypothetical protein
MEVMAISKDILVQYPDLVKEVQETKDKITKLEHQIANIEKQLVAINEGGHVKDKVKGGLGGIQNFNIEGFPEREYQQKRKQLQVKRIILNGRKLALDEQETKLLQMVSDIEEFLNGIEDSFIRRIINLRVIEQLSWNKVADKMGGYNTEDSVRMTFERFLKKK